MQLLQKRRSKRGPKWGRIILIVVILVVALVAWKFSDVILPRYRLWKQDRALAQARDYIAKHDAPNAQLALDVALKTVPGRPEVLRAAADMLEQVGAPQAMRLRRAVVMASPDSAEDAAALVLTCVHFGDYNAAKDALSSMSPDLAIQPVALRAALMYALATGDAPVADSIFKQLAPQFPNDEDLKVAQALLSLRRPQKEKRDEARAALEKLAGQQPKYALQIHRELAGEALQSHRYDDAKKWFAAIRRDPGSNLKDRLQEANVELVVEKKPFPPVFAELSPLAMKNEADITQFVQWLLVQNRAEDARTWLAKLPAPLPSTTTVKAAQADVAAQLRDWPALQHLLEEGAWGPIPKETLKLAFAAEAVDNPGKPSLRRETWELALNSAGTNLSALRILQNLASLWHWDSEVERTLWSIARGFPDQTWAHQTLFNQYRQARNTNGMREVLSALRDFDGSVPRYQYDWALLTLLTDASSTWNPPKDVMRQLYEADHTNATYATGYAFALALAGRGKDALEVVQKMSPVERDYPLRQPYLAYVYGVARKGPELEHAVSMAAGANFLPEEVTLFTRAREELERKPPPPRPSKPAAANATPSKP